MDAITRRRCAGVFAVAIPEDVRGIASLFSPGAFAGPRPGVAVLVSDFGVRPTGSGSAFVVFTRTQHPADRDMSEEKLGGNAVTRPEDSSFP
jgi:hypothetical protein